MNNVRSEQTDRYIYSRRLLRWQARVHVALPVAVLVLVAILTIDFVLSSSPQVNRAAVVLGYSVIAYFALELSIEYTLYRDKRRFFRDRYVDILLVIPVVFVLPFAVGIGGLILSIRVLKVLETAALVRFDLLLTEQLAILGSRLQKLGKLIRSGKIVLRERLER